MQVIRGAGYIRVSTTEQATRGLSLEAQEAEIRRYAKERGIVLVQIYVDRGITARKKLHRREAFAQMMRDVDAGLIDRIIVMRLDRWFRNVYDYHKMMNEHLIPHNVDWCAVKEDYDTTTTNGRLMINLRLAIAEQECDTDGDRIRDVQENMIQKGCWPFGQAPLGYRIVNKHLEKDPEQEECIRYFFEHMLLNGSLRAALFATNERYGTTYEYKRAQHLSRASVYYGEYGTNKSFCPAYITREEHERIRYLASKNIRVRKSPDKVAHLFSGLLICSDCGRRLSGQTIRRPSGVYVTYRCAHAYDNNGCPNTKSFSERIVENYLLHYMESELEEFIFTVEAESKTISLPIDNTEQIRAKQEKVKELFINDLIDLPEYKKRIDELESKIIVTAPKPRANTARLKKLLETNALSFYQTFTRDEKRAFWRGIIKELHIYRGTVQGPPIFL